jgi:CheY-like chemotaxis protein
MPRAVGASQVEPRAQRHSEVQITGQADIGSRASTPGSEVGRRVAVHEAAGSRSTSLSDVRLLVVDDDDALREMLSTALTLRGARVTAVRRAEEARLLSGPFDAALIDMTLEDLRGDELLAQLRKRGSVSAAMLVTGSAQAPRLVLGGEPDDWVRKPFEVAELVDRLKRTLERHQMLHAAAANMRR